MMQDRRIAFGLAATAIAMKARVGQLRVSDQVGFAARALEWVHDDELARLAVVDFLTHCQRDPVGAGSRLQEFILDWSDGDLPPQDPQLVLAGIFSGADTTRAVSFVSRRAS
jgi:hypothetical protein